MNRTDKASGLSVLFLVLALASQAGATAFSLSRVADMSTAIPNGTGNFAVFSSPVISGGNVAFSAFGVPGDQERGIYFFDGITLSRVADLNTAIPDGTGTFTVFFESEVISGSNVAFHAGGSSDQRGIYLFDGASLSRVADLNTAIPNGTGNFTGFNRPVISGSNVVFRGHGEGQEGIYLFDGATLSRVADLNTAIPNGTGNFSSFGIFNPPVISGSNVAFLAFGSSDQRGIYLFDGAALSRVADLNTAIPKGTGNFTVLILQAISGGHVAFVGVGGASFDQRGIYLFDGAMLSRVADFNTHIPGGTGPFAAFDQPVISGGNVAFLGSGGANLGQEGIYFFDGATLSRVADKRTHIPNGTGNFIGFGNPTISGSNLIFFGVGFEGREDGIYLFDGTKLNRVADHRTPIPDGTGNFTGFGGEALSGDNIAFQGQGTGQQGIYLARVQPFVHDLAVVMITAPTIVTQGSGAKPVRVEIQNRSDHNEVIMAASLGDGITTGLVRLDVSPVGVDDDGENCQPAIVTLDAAKNAARFRTGPKTLRPKATFTVNFLVTYDCPAATPKNRTDSTSGDYRHVATVFHGELGAPDSHGADDTCPRDALPGGVDPNPDGTTKDKGCGARKPDDTFGNPVLTDVVAK